MTQQEDIMEIDYETKVLPIFKNIMANIEQMQVFSIPMDTKNYELFIVGIYGMGYNRGYVDGIKESNEKKF